MEDFVTHRINWEDKAKNIVDIVDELNLGLQSVVFFDDSPFERTRVQATLPEVLVPELPKDPEDYHTFLLNYVVLIKLILQMKIKLEETYINQNPKGQNLNNN